MRGGEGNVSEMFVSFQGEGLHAGRRHLFVRLGGCPLRCRYCDTPGSLVPVPECRILGPDGERRRANPFTPVELEAEVQALVAAAPPLAALAVTGGEPLAQTDFLAAWLGMRTGERARWEEHEACLGAAVAAGRAIYVKMPVDEGTLAEEVEHGARLVAAVDPAVPLFLTPLTPPDGTNLTISAATLERLHALASRRHPDVRVMPQLHKVLGIL